VSADVGKIFIRPPDLDVLSDDQRDVVARLLSLHDEWQPSWGPFPSVHPELVEQLSAVSCSSFPAFFRMYAYASSHVYWTRSRAFCLAQTLQLASRKTIFNPFATELFASAQINVNEDLSLSSMENAVLLFTQLEQKDPAVRPFGERARGRLRDVYLHLRDWYWPTSRETVQPLRRHLYQTRCFAELKLFAPHLPTEGELTAKDFEDVANACGSDAVYYRVLARRFAGEWHERSDDFKAARSQYELALDQAVQVGLDTEIGHLRRHLGHAFAVLNQLPEAAEQLELAWRHELENGCAYWRALSFGELGDVEAALADREGTTAGRDLHEDRAQDAYRNGRDSIDMFVSRQSIPVCRAIAQQAYRPYADDALHVVAHTPDVVDWLGEIEVGCPRNAMGMVLEGRLVREFSDEPTVEEGGKLLSLRESVMRSRAYYSEWWEDFRPGETNEQAADAYLDSLFPLLAQEDDRRAAYLDMRNSPGVMTALMAAFDSRRCAKRFVNDIRWSGVTLLLFSLSQESLTLQTGVDMTMTVFDAATGQLRGAPSHIPLGEEGLRPHHRAYNEEVAQAGADAGLIAPDASMKKAIADLLDTYSEILSDPLRDQLAGLKGQHVKIIPRDAMHEVPLHAVPIDGTRLVDHCDVSYGLTLGLLAEAHTEERVPCERVTIVLDSSMTWYEGLVRRLAHEHGNKVRVLTNPALSVVVDDLRSSPPDEILVACHGSYDTDDPQASLLCLDGSTETRFADLLEKLRLDNCGCVTLGACESGLGRSLVTAEYIGLPVALLSAGPRQVIGTLWETPELAAAVLLTHYCGARLAGSPVVAALNQAQRETKETTTDGILEWISSALPYGAERFSSIVPTLFPEGFSDPYYWAAFYALGDI